VCVCGRENESVRVDVCVSKVEREREIREVVCE